MDIKDKIVIVKKYKITRKLASDKEGTTNLSFRSGNKLVTNIKTDLITYKANINALGQYLGVGGFNYPDTAINLGKSWVADRDGYIWMIIAAYEIAKHGSGLAYTDFQFYVNQYYITGCGHCEDFSPDTVTELVVGCKKGDRIYIGGGYDKQYAHYSMWPRCVICTYMYTPDDSFSYKSNAGWPYNNYFFTRVSSSIPRYTGYVSYNNYKVLNSNSNNLIDLKNRYKKYTGYELVIPKPV